MGCKAVGEDRRSAVLQNVGILQHYAVSHHMTAT